jgi:hypothetical protein
MSPRPSVSASSYHCVLKSPCCCVSASPRRRQHIVLTSNPFLIPEIIFLWHATCSIYRRQARNTKRDPAAATSLSAACRCASHPPSNPSVNFPKREPGPKGRVPPRLLSLLTIKKRPFSYAENFCDALGAFARTFVFVAGDEICHFEGDVFCRIASWAKRFGAWNQSRRRLVFESRKNLQLLFSSGSRLPSQDFCFTFLPPAFSLLHSHAWRMCCRSVGRFAGGV